MGDLTTARIAAFSIALLALGPGGVRAQQRPTVDPTEYGRWESLGQVVLSPDGRWAAYPVTRVDEGSELRIWSAAADSTGAFPWGSSPIFSSDSRWVAWFVGASTEERARLEEADETVRTGASVLELNTGAVREFDNISAVHFDASGRFLALTGYPPEDAGGKGSDIRLLDLQQGGETTFGNVGSAAWSDSESLLAMAVATGENSGNGVQLYDAAGGRLRSLDNSGSAYKHLVWREGAADLAALRSQGDAGDEGTAHDVLAWRRLDQEPSAPLVLNAHAEDVADSLEIVGHRQPEWSQDGRTVTFGLRPGRPEPEVTEDEAVEDTAPDSAAASDEEPELPGVQIWHSKDVAVYAQQTATQARDTLRTLAAVWHLDSGRVVQLGTELGGSVQLLGGWSHATEEISDPYPWGTMFGRPYHDVWTIDTKTGEREKALTEVRYAWPSDGGEWLLSFDGEHYSTLELKTGTRRNITAGIETVFADTTFDTPTDMLPPVDFGPGGWLAGDEAVLLYDHHDIWRVAPDGSGASRITDGGGDGITYRVAQLGDTDDGPGLDPTKSIYLTLYGEWTEKRGFGRLTPSGTVEQLVFEDAQLRGLVRADSAEVYGYVAMARNDPPDFFIADAELETPRQITAINPFIAEYAWGDTDLIDFESETGRPLQAVLHYPANYEPGTAVPTIVYTYEMLSPQVHVFENPSERDYYNVTAWTQKGYAVLLPDIVYRARDPGISALESVRAAVAKVVEMGVTDPDAVGLIGHSWGGYQATFLPTRTDIFAASVAGAPLTDFVSFMGALHWNPGLPELSHWETGQARMEVPFWEDPEAHRRNSPIHEVHQLETPLLMAFGNEDGVVDWDQGTEFYNFARRAGKQMVLLVYEGEDHGFRQEKNQVDYHRRILEWFGHYLKGDPAPSWITKGVKLEDLNAEKKRVAKLRN